VAPRARTCAQNRAGTRLTEARGVHFRTVEDGLSTQGSTGKQVLHMLGAVAQLERDLIL
jgi:DNA invertase Pin-like site-specific DNA recombinase